MLNFLRTHSFRIAVIIWALFITYIVFLAKPQVVYIETEPEIIYKTVTEYVEVEVEVPVEVETTAYYKDITLTEEEWLMLGQVIEAEAGNQPAVGKRAIVEVIFNRVMSDEWPDTVAEVLTQSNPRQFTKFSDVDEKIAWDNAGYIVAVLQEEVTILNGDCVYFATHKNANGSHYVQIGSHYFAY